MRFTITNDDNGIVIKVVMMMTIIMTIIIRVIKTLKTIMEGVA